MYDFRHRLCLKGFKVISVSIYVKFSIHFVLEDILAQGNSMPVVGARNNRAVKRRWATTKGRRAKEIEATQQRSTAFWCAWKGANYWYCGWSPSKWTSLNWKYNTTGWTTWSCLSVSCLSVFFHLFSIHLSNKIIVLRHLSVFLARRNERLTAEWWWRSCARRISYVTRKETSRFRFRLDKNGKRPSTCHLEAFLRLTFPIAACLMRWFHGESPPRYHLPHHGWSLMNDHCRLNALDCRTRASNLHLICRRKCYLPSRHIPKLKYAFKGTERGSSTLSDCYSHISKRSKTIFTS